MAKVEWTARLVNDDQLGPVPLDSASLIYMTCGDDTGAPLLALDLVITTDDGHVVTLVASPAKDGGGFWANVRRDGE